MIYRSLVTGRSPYRSWSVDSGAGCKCRAGNLEHDGSRLPAKSLLSTANHRIAEPGKEKVRSGKSQDVVPHAVITPVPFDQKPFLAGSCMVWQRAVGEAESLHHWPVFVSPAHDAKGVEPPQADGTS